MTEKTQATEQQPDGPRFRDRTVKPEGTIRKQAQNPLRELAEKHGLPGLAELYMPSFSSRTIVYKGLLLATQVGSFYDDLRDR